MVVHPSRHRFLTHALAFPPSHGGFGAAIPSARCRKHRSNPFDPPSSDMIPGARRAMTPGIIAASRDGDDVTHRRDRAGEAVFMNEPNDDFRSSVKMRIAFLGPHFPLRDPAYTAANRAELGLPLSDARCRQRVRPGRLCGQQSRHTRFCWEHPVRGPPGPYFLLSQHEWPAGSLTASIILIGHRIHLN
jgi:hypothetical protein